MIRKICLLFASLALTVLLAGAVPVSASDSLQDPDYLIRNRTSLTQAADAADPSSAGSLLQSSGGTVSPFTGLTYTHNASHASGAYEVQNGIDVSKWDDTIDWAAAKEGGVSFAFIRAAHRNTGDGVLVNDATMSVNMAGCDANTIPYGAYIFSQAITEDEAVEEADRILSLVAGKNVTLPIVMDYEIAEAGKGRLAEANLTKEEATAIAEAFCRRIRSAGYTPMIYTDADRLTNGIDGTALHDTDGFEIWMANWTTKSSYAGPYEYWQYSASGSVPGVSTACDCDFRYVASADDRLVPFSGVNRYDTMQQIVKAGSYPTGGTVYVASGSNFPDALSASGICGTTDSPLVITKPESLSAEAASALAQLAPSHILILGGSDSVSTDAENAIRAAHPDAAVTRIAGKNRYDTAVQIFRNGSGWAKQAVIVSGSSYADALSAAPYAYASKCPVFLSHESTGLDEETLAAIQSGGFASVVIAGGFPSVPAIVETQLDLLPSLRFAGTNRYDTCSLFADWAMGKTDDAIRPLVLLTCTNPGVATGKNFADALSGASFCGKKGSVLFLADPGTSGMTCILKNLAANASDVEKVSVFGSTASVPETVREAIRALL